MEAKMSWARSQLVLSQLRFDGLSHTQVLVLVCIAVVAGFYMFGRNHKAGLPPGPPVLPIVGNLHQVPSTRIHEKFAAWAKLYGSIFTLKFGSSNVVVLCDRKAVHELFDKKGAIYSDRPDSFMNHALGTADNVFMRPLDDVWKEKRKLISHNFSPAQLDKKHWRVQEAESTLLMHDLLQSPLDFDKHIRRYTASIVHVLVHGFHANSYNDFWGSAVYELMYLRSAALEPGSRPPADEFPILKLLPKFLVPWYRLAEKSKEVTLRVWSEARRSVDARRAAGDKRDCMADMLLDQFESTGWPMSQSAFNLLLGEMIEGGADTSAAGLRTLILAFVLYPEVQERARAEIDAACGTARSPKWTDFDSIPYVNALIKEGLRWRPVAPTGLPHRNRQDDVYDGMRIPKDSTVFMGVWALHHDPNHYKEPQTFDPKRFAQHDKLASYYAGTHHYAYGAGRRICPGMHLAERNLWRTVAKMLWAFEFKAAVDEAGKTIPLDPNDFIEGLVREPKPYKIQIKPRSEEHIATIKNELGDAVEFLKAWS